MASGTLGRCSLHGWIPVFTVQGRWQTGVVWVSGLLMSTLRIEWVGLWYGQAYVMDKEHRLILSMIFWMHRDTAMRSWGPLLCHSSTTITSYCRMIMHGPMLQGSVHNSWKLNIPVLAWPAYSPDMSHIEHVWDALDRRIRQRVPVPANIQQLRLSSFHWRGVDQYSTGHNQQPDQLYAKEMCCTTWGKWWSHPILAGFRTPPNTVKPHFRVAFYCGQPKAHLCNNHAV